MRYKELAIGVVIAAGLLFVFIFRASIFRTSSPEPQEQTPPPKTISQNTQATTTPKMQPIPVYHGRKLDEVKMDSETAKSLSEQQKMQISADISKYAGMIRDTPEYGAAWLQLAIVKKGIGDYVGARDIWIYVTVLRPHEITAFLNLGDLYTNYLKDYPKAEQNLRAAIQIDPKNELAYMRLSDLYTYFYKEKAGQAEVVLKEGIAANPNNANLAHALARLYEHKAN